MDTCHLAHIGVKLEVGNNFRGHSKTPSAVILLSIWFLGRTAAAALDVFITSPLNPITLLEAGGSATVAAQN